MPISRIARAVMCLGGIVGVASVSYVLSTGSAGANPIDPATTPPPGVSVQQTVPLVADCQVTQQTVQALTSGTLTDVSAAQMCSTPGAVMTVPGAPLPTTPLESPPPSGGTGATGSTTSAGVADSSVAQTESRLERVWRYDRHAYRAGAAGTSHVANVATGSCGWSSLYLFSEPAVGDGWASFHETISIDGVLLGIVGGSVTVPFHNYTTGANGGPGAVVGFLPFDTVWNNIDSVYTQNGWVLATMQGTVTTDVGITCSVLYPQDYIDVYPGA